MDSETTITVGPEIHRKALPGVEPLTTIVLLASLVCLFFWKVLFFSDNYHIPYDLYGYHYPLTHEVFTGLKQGYLPLWDPYIYSGIPLLGNINAQLFYPPTLLLLKVSDWMLGSFPYRMMEYLQVIHYVIAGFCAYLLGRSFSLSQAPATLVAIIYSFGEFFATQTQHLGVINGASWAPLIFYFLKRSCDTRRLFYASGAGISLALSILAGFPAMVLATVVVTLVASLIVCSWELKRRSWDRATFMVLALATTLVSGVALAAIQLVPSAELARLSVTEEQHRFAGLEGMPPQAYASLLVPTIYGAGQPNFWAGAELTYCYLYLGVASLILAVLSILFPRRSGTFLILALTLFSFFWALGEATPLGSWIWMIAPATLKGGIYTYCVRAFFDLGVALLAGFGLEKLSEGFLTPTELSRIKRLLTFLALFVIGLILLSLLLHGQAASTEFGKPERQRLVVITQGINLLVIFLILVSLVIYWRRNGYLQGRAAAWLLVFITGMDLFTAGSGKTFNTGRGARTSLSTADSVQGATYPLDLIKADPDYEKGSFRVETLTSSKHWLLSCRLWQLQNANGNDPWLSKDYLRFRSLFSDIQHSRQFVLKSSESTLVDLLNIKYVVVSKDRDIIRNNPKFKLVGDRYYRVYLNPSFLPRAFLVPNAKVMGSEEVVLSSMVSGEFNPRQCALVEKAAAPLVETLNSSDSYTGSPITGSAQITWFTPNAIRLAVETDRETILLLSEVFYPGWSVTVDDHREEIIRADGIFRAVKVQPGKHLIVFRYQPNSLTIGASISCSTLVSLCFSWLWAFRRNRHNSPAKVKH